MVAITVCALESMAARARCMRHINGGGDTERGVREASKVWEPPVARTLSLCLSLSLREGTATGTPYRNRTRHVGHRVALHPNPCSAFLPLSTLPQL